MTCALVHASYSLPEWQAVKLTFFAPLVKNVLTIVLMYYTDTCTLCSVCRCIPLMLGLALLSFLTHSVHVLLNYPFSLLWSQFPSESLTGDVWKLLNGKPWLVTLMVFIRYVVLSYKDHYHDVTCAEEKRFSQIKPYIAERDFVKQARKNKKSHLIPTINLFHFRQDFS